MSITVYALTAAHFQINASYLINVPSTLLKLYYYIDTDEIPGFFLLLVISSSHAVKILFLSFTCEDIGVTMVTNFLEPKL